jgi:hypothetical protein
MKRSVLLAGAVVMAVIGVPGFFGSTFHQAVAMDWLTPRLESQRHDNIRRHQQRIRQQRANKQQRIKMTAGDHASRPSPGLSPERREQLMRQLEPEYRRRVQLHGQASADNWLKRTAWRLGAEEGRKARLRAQGR